MVSEKLVKRKIFSVSRLLEFPLQETFPIFLLSNFMRVQLSIRGITDWREMRHLDESTNMKFSSNTQ